MTARRYHKPAVAVNDGSHTGQDSQRLGYFLGEMRFPFLRGFLIFFFSVIMVTGFWPVASLSATEGQTLSASTAQDAPARVLIVHDQADDPQLALELQSLLGHFQTQVSITEVQFYQRGSIQDYDVVFYLGGTHKQVNGDFLDDVYASSKPVVWMGRGIDWLGIVHPLNKYYGFEYARVDASGLLSNVEYKDISLTKTNPVTSITYVTDESRASVLAWTTGTGMQEPYIIRSGNFWFFADIPMVGTTPDSAYSAAGATEDSAFLVLADLLHDILGQQHIPQHPALIRIEDIHPNIDIDRLNSIVEYLYQNNIPFGLGLVPVYKNPATGEEVHLADKPEFVQAIKDAEAKGAVIVLHGYTHQRVGETVVDYEFWDRDTHAPPADETEQGIRDRLNAALRETREQGIYPEIWETPHYAGSNLMHSVVATDFDVIWERSEAPFFPYPVRIQETGQLDLPETLGYISLPEGNDANKLLGFAKAQRVVRDGYAAAFFHPAVDQGQLRDLINGLQDEGYIFQSPAQVAGLAYTPVTPPSWWNHTNWVIWDRISNFVGSSAMDSKIIAAVAFFIIFYYWGIFLLSRKPKKVTGKYNPDLTFVLVVPCLNEEFVIGRTLDHLLSLPDENLYVLVVDDDSEDGTRDLVLSYKSDRLLLLDHPRLLARQGKGKVLNYAYSYLMTSDLVKERGAYNVIVGVLDADGRVAPNIIEAVNPYFDDTQAGAVQVGVRISNAQTNTLTKWQNFEFLTFARISQKAREYLGSVGLGGNGQFVRLSALASLSGTPWTDCLTEDLDLGIRLTLEGWRNHYCPDSFVSQQGVPGLKPLIRQRTRWFQGHITCWRHIPALMARKAPIIARTDTIYYLLAPVLVFLFIPGSILFIFWSIYFMLTGATEAVLNPLNYLTAVLVWYLFSFGALPTVVWTFWREEKEMSAWKAFLWAHVFSFFYVIWFIAGVKAIYRLAHGEGAWAKTARTKESSES